MTSMANLTVPIIIDWKAIEEYLAQHDIVEVVRCKDCKHYTMPNDGLGVCEHPAMNDRHYFLLMKPDDYCSRAERRTDDCI